MKEKCIFVGLRYFSTKHVNLILRKGGVRLSVFWRTHPPYKIDEYVIFQIDP